MLTKRIIACLDVKDGRVVKGVQFRNHVDMGDILELSQRYADDGVDELVFYDITASSDGRVVDKSWVNQIMPHSFVYRFHWEYFTSIYNSSINGTCFFSKVN